MNPNRIGRIVLIAVVLVGYLYIKKLERQRDEFLSSIITLDAQLSHMAELHTNVLKEKFRKGEKVVAKTRFIPPEGAAIATTDKEGVTRLKVYNKGITFRPGLSLKWEAGETVVGLSPKVFYWGRMGVVLDANKNRIAVGVSRYVDDLIPYWRPKNLELCIFRSLLQLDRDSKTWNIALRITL